MSRERDSLNWAKGRGLSKKSYFSDRTIKLGLRHTFGCNATKLDLRRWGRDEKPWIGNPGLYQALLLLILLRIEPPILTSWGNYQILSQKDPLQAVGVSWLACTGVDTGYTTLIKLRKCANIRQKRALVDPRVFSNLTLIRVRILCTISDFHFSFSFKLSNRILSL